MAKATEVNFRSQQKSRFLKRALEGDHALVHLDSRREDVEVPEDLSDNHALTLKLSERFNGNMELSDSEVQAELKFSGTYFNCRFSWDAVWAISTSDGEQKTWVEDMPKSLLLALSVSKLKEAAQKLTGKIVPSSNSNQPPDESSAPPEKKRRQLKRIK